MILKRICAVIGNVCSVLGIENVGSSKTLVIHCVIQKIPSYGIIAFPIYRQNDIDYPNYDMMPVIKCVGQHKRQA
jgi:hypothetical protein